jgi:hypothetical protein
MHSWESTECLGIQILTIKLLVVISIVFGFFGTPYSRATQRVKIMCIVIVNDFLVWFKDKCKLQSQSF